MSWASDRRRELRYWASRDWPAVVALGVYLAVLIGGGVYILSRVDDVRSGLCALRHEREAAVTAGLEGIKASEKYLLAHPNGLPSLGITAADLRASIATRQAHVTLLQQTVSALSVVHCPE